jgi:predicted RNase H-like HicB family nuclease
MKKGMSYVVWQDGEWFIAQCLEVDVASQGLSEQEATDNLRDALELYFRPPVATIIPRVRRLEFEVRS